MKKNISNASYEAPRCFFSSEVPAEVLCTSPSREVEFEDVTDEILW